MARPKRKRKPATPAPAAPVRVSESPLARMKRGGILSIWEFTAADEIVAAYNMSAGLPVSRDVDLGIPISEPRPDAADERAARKSDLVRTYTRWLAEVRGTDALAAVQGVILGELALRTIEREMHWRNGTAISRVRTGLRHFAALRGNTPRGARDWKITGHVYSKPTR